MRHWKKLQFKVFSNASIYFEIFYAVILLIEPNTVKTDLLRHPWGICSSIVDVNVKNSPSNEVEWTNWSKNKSHYKLVRRKIKMKQKKSYSLPLRIWKYSTQRRMYTKHNKLKRRYSQSINLKALVQCV